MDRVLVVEELEPVIEEELRAVAQTMGRNIPIQGKGVGRFDRLFEYDPARVRTSIAQHFGYPIKAAPSWTWVMFPLFRVDPPTFARDAPIAPPFMPLGK